MDSLIGQKINQYEIVGLLGKGGMASVYRARQTSVKRDVAIKVIKSGLTDSEDFIKRFEREAQTAASLNHPHILKIFDYGDYSGLVYLVMELQSGGSLADLIKDGMLPMERIVKIMEQIGDALDYAHSRSIIHRDLKPQNVMMDERQNAILTDFGIAKLLTDVPQLTATGMAIGTPAYMSPEQWQGMALDARSDIYTLGIMLYEMLTGRLPFEAETASGYMFQHIQSPPPPLNTIRSDLPISLEAVIERALAKRREDRYSTASDLAAAFKAALAPTSQPLQTRPLPKPSPSDMPTDINATMPTALAPASLATSTPAPLGVLPTEVLAPPAKGRSNAGLLVGAAVVIVILVAAAIIIAAGRPPAAPTPTAQAQAQIATQTPGTTQVATTPATTVTGPTEPPTLASSPTAMPTATATVTATPTSGLEATMTALAVIQRTMTAVALLPTHTPAATETPEVTETPVPPTEVALVPFATRTPYPASEQQISFISTGDDFGTLYVIGANGKNPEEMNNQLYVEAEQEVRDMLQPKENAYGSFYYIGAVWSPDGRYLLFSWEVTLTEESTQKILGGKSYLYLLEQRSSGSFRARRLPEEAIGVFDYLTWLPDSKTFAYTARRDGKTQIFTGDVETLSINPLLQLSGVNNRFPTWSPDGKKVAFVSDQSGTDQVYVADANGANARLLTGKLAFPQVDAPRPTPTPDNATKVLSSGKHMLSWSPDGMRLAFLWFETKGKAAYIVRADGSDGRLVIAPEDAPEYLLWADNETLAFTSDRLKQGTYQLYTVSADGSNLRALTEFEDGIINDRLSAATERGQIVFSTMNFDVYTVQSDGNNLEKLRSSAVYGTIRR